jgi:hypothetical protein
MILREERELIQFRGSSHFSLQELPEGMQGMSPQCELPWRRH